MNRAANMPKRYRSIREQFDRVFRGTSAERPRSITCGAYVNNNMGFAVAKLYIKKYFDENARNQVKYERFSFREMKYKPSEALNVVLTATQMRCLCEVHLNKHAVMSSSGVVVCD